MSAPAEKFVALLSHGKPRFVDEGKAAKVTPLRHEAFPPASADEIAILAAQLRGAGDDLLALCSWSLGIRYLWDRILGQIRELT